MNEGIGKEFYRERQFNEEVSNFGPFNESPDSKN